jgi:hypothetical protein
MIPNGSRRVMRKGSFTLKPEKIKIVIGDLIDASSYTIDKVQEFIDKTHQTIMANFDPEYAP